MRKLYVVVAVVAVAVPTFVSALSAGAQRSSDRALVAELNGANEIGQDGERGAGDRNGRGAFSAILDGRELCYGIQVKNIEDPSASHIHRGRSTQSGPVVQQLEPPTSGDPGASGACARIPARLARAIVRTPGRYYVNVHNAGFPDGAVRGQLTRAAEEE